MGVVLRNKLVYNIRQITTLFPLHPPLMNLELRVVRQPERGEEGGQQRRGEEEVQVVAQEGADLSIKYRVLFSTSIHSY